MAVERKHLETATAGYQKTFLIRMEYRGAWLNGDDYDTPTVKAVKPNGSTYVTPTGAWKSPQTGEDLGALTVVFTSASLDTAGTWKFDVYLAESGGNAEPILDRFTFECKAKETEA
jgi:hypothetical protein